VVKLIIGTVVWFIGTVLLVAIFTPSNSYQNDFNYMVETLHIYNKRLSRLES